MARKDRMTSELLMTVPNKVLVAAFQSLGYSFFKSRDVSLNFLNDMNVLINIQ